MPRRLDEPKRARVVAMLGDPARPSYAHIAAAAGASIATVQRIATELNLKRVAGGDARATGGVEVGASLPFGPGPQGPGNIPPGSWNTDQAPPPPRDLVFDPQYHGHTFHAPAAPLAFEGWTVERIREAIALHDQGYFVESSLLSVVVSRFGPVHAALKQAVAPALRLPRYIKGGQRGLARLMRSWVESQIAPSDGLMPSAQFPPQLWGSMFREFINMGFCVLQHAYSEPYDLAIDRQVFEGVRDCYTRLWPAWALNYYAYRKTFVALTTEGPIDVVSGDGKFTVIGDTDTPHHEGALRAAGLEVLDGVLIKQARASYIDRYGSPKWFATMPPGTATRSKEGVDFFNALEVAQGPNGRAVIPYGADVKSIELNAASSTVFKDALDNVWQYCAAIFLGSDGTLSKGTGVYTAPMFQGVALAITDRNLKAGVRGINQGHVKPQLAFNFGSSISMAAGWEDPVVDVPLPHPDGDERMSKEGERLAQLHTLIAEERALGLVVDQDRVDLLAERLDVRAPQIGKTNSVSIALAPADLGKVVLVSEARSAQGLPPLGDKRDAMTLAELEAEAKAKAAAAGGVAPVADAPPPNEAPSADNTPSPDGAPTQEQAA